MDCVINVTPSRHSSPASSTKAGSAFPIITTQEIERFVVNQIREIAHDPKLIRDTLAEASRQVKNSLRALESERSLIEKEISQIHAEINALAVGKPNAKSTLQRSFSPPAFGRKANSLRFVHPPSVPLVTNSRRAM